MRDEHNEDHDRGLSFDLQTISKQVMERRRALAWFGGAGLTALLAGCGGGGGTSSDSSTTGTSSSSSSSSASSSSSSSSSDSSSASGTCTADPAETSGPYPADGTNTASGSTSDILTQSGIVRSDIRSSFISSTDSSAGVLVTITLTLVSATCAPLSGYAIYFWHADHNGHYSLYTAPTESYLRGVQVTDANGQVTFTTFFPPAYDGRWPHFHIEIFSSLASATTGKNAVLTTQLCMPEALCNTVFADTTTYPTAASIFKGLSLSTDSVFSSSSAAQIAVQTPAFVGSTTAGYTATAQLTL
jgi:protocatechuate 3,4-dioxygenase beta subunit